MNATAALEMMRNNPRAAEQAQQRLGEVLTRSATDPEFRRLLLSDARAALAQHFGREIPETAKISFIESVPGTATVVLPDALDPNAELSEADLEAVAGGAVPVVVWILCGIGAAALGDALF